MKTIEAIENKLKELLLPVFGLDSVDQIKPQDSLINDLGADSLDFVEIIYILEFHFGVVVKADEIMVKGANISTDDLFIDGRLSEEGAKILQKNFSDKKDFFKYGMYKVELFSLLTVRDLAILIHSKTQGVFSA